MKRTCKTKFSEKGIDMITDRQKEIIEASLEIIYRQGIQGLTIKNLSKSIGISEPAIYRHYDSKIDILLAILDHFKSNGEQLFKIVSDNSDLAIQKIEKIFYGYVNAFETNPSFVTVIFSEEIFRNETILHEKIAGIMEQNASVIKALVAEGQAKGNIRNDIESKYLSLIVIGSLRMLVKKWQMGDRTFGHKSEVKKVFNSIKKLFSPLE